MKSNEAKKIAQCVAHMIGCKLNHNIRQVPLVLNELVTEYLKTYVPESDEKINIIETKLENCE